MPEFIKTTRSRVIGLIAWARANGINIIAPEIEPSDEVALISVESAGQNTASIVVYPTIPSCWYFRPDINISPAALIRKILSRETPTITEDVREMVRCGQDNPQLRDIIRATILRAVPLAIMAQGAVAIIAWLDGAGDEISSAPDSFADLNAATAPPPAVIAAPEVAGIAPPATPVAAINVVGAGPTITYTISVAVRRRVIIQERDRFSDLDIEIPEAVHARGENAVDEYVRLNPHVIDSIVGWEDGEFDYDTAEYGAMEITEIESLTSDEERD